MRNSHIWVLISGKRVLNRGSHNREGEDVYICQDPRP